MYKDNVSTKMSKIFFYQWQPENCENRNNPDLVQAFLKKWWVESDFKAPNLPISLWLKVVKLSWEFVLQVSSSFPGTILGNSGRGLTARRVHLTDIKWGPEARILKTTLLCTIRVITKLSNSEQSYKGKVKTHKYINSASGLLIISGYNSR
jgi:hypothetical protein